MLRLPSLPARRAFATLTAVGLLAAGSAFAGKNVGSVNFTLGGKRMTSDWYLSAPKTNAIGDSLFPRSSQPALGMEVAWGREGWPVLIAVDLLHSYDDGQQRYPANPFLSIPAADVRRRARTIELGLGARRSWNVIGLTPYVGAGGSVIRAHIKYEMSYPGPGLVGTPGPTVGGRHMTVGFWFGGGLYRGLGPRLQIGATGRYSKADITFPEWSEVRGEQGGYTFVRKPTKAAVGGSHFGLVVGWTFPKRP